jgi:hypothetical protein
MFLQYLSQALPADHTRQYISSGAAGTAQTIQGMRKLVSESLRRMQRGVTHGKRAFNVRQLIGQIIAPCPAKDYYCYAKALYEYCRDQIKYTFDPVGVELIEAPERILFESKIADCDSIVVVLATLVEAIGLPARFVTVRADLQRPNEYSHVYLEVNIPGKGWVGADPTMPKKEFGWRPDPRFPATRWPASLDPEDADANATDDVLEMPNMVNPSVRGMGYMGEGYTPGVTERVDAGGWPGRDLRAVTMSRFPMTKPGLGSASDWARHVKSIRPVKPPVMTYCVNNRGIQIPCATKKVLPIISPGFCVNSQGTQIDCKLLQPPTTGGGLPVYDPRLERGNAKTMHGMRVANMRGVRGMGGMGEDMQVDPNQDLWTQVWNYVTSYVPADTFNVFRSIMDSSYENELVAARADMKANQQVLRNSKQYLDTMPQGYEREQLQAWYDSAYAKQLATEQSVIEAIAQYNNAVWFIKSYPGVDSILSLAPHLGWRNPQMLGMGEPISISLVVIVVAAAAAIVSLCLAAPAVLAQVNYGVLTMRADKAGIAELIKSPPTKLPGASGSLTDLFGSGSMTTYVLVGAALLFGYSYFKGKGGPSGVTA